MIKIKNERIFFALSDIVAEPNEVGRKQFFDQQSRGKEPLNPDAYYICLVRGKWAADNLTEEYRKAFYAESGYEWRGLVQLWLDWEGGRFVLPYLLSWHKKPKIRPTIITTWEDWLNQYLDDLPEWIGKEISLAELGEKYGVIVGMEDPHGD